jgi:putative phosphoesterase
MAVCNSLAGNENARTLDRIEFSAGSKIMSRNPKTIGLISDTHGLLRPQALRALEGSDLIIHAGDVGDPEILEALKTLAPVFAVRGNVDTDPWALALPETEVIETDLATIYILHDVHALDLDPVAAGFHIIVSGHSHKSSRTEHGGVLFLNPGSAGPRRFDLPVTVARLDVSQKPWKFNIFDLVNASSK